MTTTTNEQVVELTRPYRGTAVPAVGTYDLDVAHPPSSSSPGTS